MDIWKAALTVARKVVKKVGWMVVTRVERKVGLKE